MILSQMHRTLDDDKLNDPIPTFEVTLSALELDFDRQLSAAMDNIFDNEFAALRDLEPIVTTTTPLAFSDNLEAPLAGVKASKASVSILGSDCKGGRLLKSVHNPGDDGETITRTTSIDFLSSGLDTSNDQPGNSRRSASLSSYTSDDDTITRTTNNPAASSSSTRGSDKPTLRETNVSQEEPTIRTTNTSAFGPILDCSPKQTSHNTSQNVDEQVVITQSTKAVELAYRSPAEGMNGEAAPPSNAMPLIPNAFLPTNPAQTFGASYPMGSQSPFVSELPRGTVWSSGRASSHSIPLVGITLPEVVGEDIEMTISDLTASQGIFPEATGDSSHGIYDKNATGWHQAASSFSRTLLKTVTVPSSFSSSYSLPIPQTEGGLPAPYPTMAPAAHVPFDASPPLPLSYLPRSHPSIFELIQPEFESPCPMASPAPYVIPPAVVPENIWQAELAREQLRYSDNSRTNAPRRRTRISPPYFFRTPLVLKKQVRRGNKVTANSFMFGSYHGTLSQYPPSKYDESKDKSNARQTRTRCVDAYQTKPRERSPSPASSCSSEGSSIYFAATSTRPYDRKLSSPPPFKRRCLEEPIESPSGLLGSALKSVSWLLSWQA